LGCRNNTSCDVAAGGALGAPAGTGLTTASTRPTSSQTCSTRTRTTPSCAPRAPLLQARGLDSKLNSWARMLFEAVLGEHIAPFRVRSHNQPVCFEARWSRGATAPPPSAASCCRRCRSGPGPTAGTPYARCPSLWGCALPLAPSLVWPSPASCPWVCPFRPGYKIPLSSTVLYCTVIAVPDVCCGEQCAEGESKEVKGFAAGTSTRRVCCCCTERGLGGWDGGHANLQDMVKALKGRCRRIRAAELVVMAESSFTNFCSRSAPPAPPLPSLCSPCVSFEVSKQPSGGSLEVFQRPRFQGPERPHFQGAERRSFQGAERPRLPRGLKGLWGLKGPGFRG